MPNQAPLSQANPPPTPGRCAASSTVGEDGEERGDLIKFYNAVFLPLVQVGVRPKLIKCLAL